MFGDAPYRSWNEIQDFRAANHRVLNHWDTEEGEWMGQSDHFFFADQIGVTSDTTLVVPRHTIAELAKSKPAKVSVTAVPPATVKSGSHDDAWMSETERPDPELDGSTAAFAAATGCYVAVTTARS